MSGILLAVIAITWVIVVLITIRFTVQRWSSMPRKVIGSLVLFPLLLVAPVADELIGKQQFESLCKTYAVQMVDEKHAMNRRVIFERRNKDEFATGTVIRIRIDPYVYRDEEKKDILVRFHILTAQGGWLLRTLGLSETTAPLLFRATCAPQDPFGFQRKFNVTVTN